MPYLRWEVTSRSRIKWFDGQGDHPVDAKVLFGPNGPPWTGPHWDKTVEAALAHHASVHTALLRAAYGLHSRAASALRAHRDTGAARVGIEGRNLDWVVYLEDGDPGSKSSRNSTGKRSALSIEFGHLTRGGGNRVGGLYILTGAADHMAKTRGKRWDK